MKKIIIASLLAMQIVTACGQRQSALANTQPTASADHDTAWYSSRMSELAAEENKLVAEFRTYKTESEVVANKARVEQIIAQADSLGDIEKTLTLEIVRKFKDTKFPAKYLAGNITYAFDYNELKEICDPKAAYYNEPELDMAKAMLAALEKRHPGLQYKELTMQDMEGKTVKLSDFVGKGKYVLVDFWASWCGPCRQEMPNVVDAYAKFKDKGLEIVGVSFDQKKDAWTAAVKQLGMTWPQMSDLKGWQCEAQVVYGVNSIPSNILIDPEGKIIATDLRGAELIKFLTQTLNRA